MLVTRATLGDALAFVAGICAAGGRVPTVLNNIP